MANNNNNNVVSLSNVIATKGLISRPNTVHLNQGFSVLHYIVDVDRMIRRSFNLIEGSMHEVIGGLISQLGYSPTSTMINKTYENVVLILINSAKAHAYLTKIWQIQNGRQSSDVFNRQMGTALFYFDDLMQYEDGEVIDELKTSCDDNISNVTWYRDFVSQLQYTYTSSTTQAVLQKLFAPVYGITQGVSAKTSYGQIWPDFNNTKGLISEFKSAIAGVKNLVDEMPFVTQVLSFLGFGIGSEFDYTRSLDQKVLPLVSNDDLFESLMTIAIPFRREGEHYEEEDNYAASLLYLIDETPISINTFATINVVSVTNALRGNIRAAQISMTFLAKVGDDHIWRTAVEPNLLETNFHMDINYSEKTYETATFVLGLTQKVLYQTSYIDFDKVKEINVFLDVQLNEEDGSVRINSSRDEVGLIAGYGTYQMDESSRALAEDASCTALLFGAYYEEDFAKKLNSIPANIIKFNK